MRRDADRCGSCIEDDLKMRSIVRARARGRGRVWVW